MNTLFIGQYSIQLKSVESTNSYAIDLLRQKSCLEGSLIYSFDQLNGRGQRGNVWESEANKNIALSIILQPHFLASDQQFLLSKIVSLSLYDLMAELLSKPQSVSIKWPNDVYVGERKIAGILVENILKENHIQSSVIGIGLNVNQIVFKTTNKATSIVNIEGKEFDLMFVLEKLCEKVEARYLQLKANKLENIHSAYLEKLYRYGIWADFKIGQEILQGKISGVSESGKLQVEFKSLIVKEFDLKKIEFI